MFKNFNRDDLEDLWKIVKSRFIKTDPVDDMDNLLLHTLNTMFELHVEDTIWTYQQGLTKVKNWKLYDSCRFRGGLLGLKDCLELLVLSAAELLLSSTKLMLLVQELQLLIRVTTAGWIKIEDWIKIKTCLPGKRPPRSPPKILLPQRYKARFCEESRIREIGLLPVRRRVARRYLSARVGCDQQLPPGHPGRMPRHERSHSTAGVLL
ncbi:hypothetical protein Tco_0508490 [Tanacetum coccineum]